MKQKSKAEIANLLDILQKAHSALKAGKPLELKDLSNRTIHSASVYQDPDSVVTAVLIYGLGKIFERSKYATFPDWPAFSRKCLAYLEKAASALKARKYTAYRRNLVAIREEIKGLRGHLRGYIEAVFRKAAVNKASRIYEHGISLEQTARLLGISIFELVEYAGKTGIPDVSLSITKSAEERLRLALSLFA